MTTFIIFILANVLNVIAQTGKTIVTIKGNKIQAALANAFAYGFYTYILILMTCELSTLTKCLVVGGCNLIGVYLVKVVEEKKDKVKLWKIEIATTFSFQVEKMLRACKVKYNYTQMQDNYYTFNIFCNTKEEVKAVKEIIKKFQCKYFISENKYNF
jgi:uncharacterized protein YebE (UPF0316 family)